MTVAFDADAATFKQLEKGEVDIQFVQKKLKARGIFKAPTKKVWETLTDFENYPKYYESVTRSEIRAKKGNQYDVYVEFKFPWPIGKVWVLNRYTLDKSNYRLKWTMLKGTLKNSDGAGSWTLKPVKDKTLATYKLNMDEGGATQWVKKQALYRSIPSVFKYLDKQMR